MAAMVFLVWVYLLAAVPFGLVLTTLYGGDVDLRAAGSGNIGATNVARVYGWRVAGAVLALDMAKGFLPVVLAWAMWDDLGMAWWSLVAVVAFVGHCWPVYLEFRGGKGVATGAGALLAIAPLPASMAAAVWGAILLTTGRSSVAALGATVAMVVFTAWLAPSALPVTAILAAGIVWRHVTNIRRIVAGEEKEVVRPVRWGKKGVPPTADEALQQDPSGGSAAPPAWKGTEEA